MKKEKTIKEIYDNAPSEPFDVTITPVPDLNGNLADIDEVIIEGPSEDTLFKNWMINGKPTKVTRTGPNSYILTVQS